MGNIMSNVPQHFSAIQQTRYKNAYKRRLMDRCILNDICNGNPENIKSLVGTGKGLKCEIYVPGVVQIRDTQPDGGIVYQEVTDATETYEITDMSYWALKFRPEDLNFMPWDPRSTYFTNATDMMARHIEKKFGRDIMTKVPSFNTGNRAGVKYGGFQLGGVGDGEAVVLYKTQRQVDEAKDVRYRSTAADYMIALANTIKENEGLSGGHVTIVIPSPVKHCIETSELKYGGLMGQRNLALGAGERGGRAEVKFLGTMDDSITIIQDNIMFPVYKNATNGRNVYPIFGMMSDACAYIDDTVFRDNAMKDISNWDEHYRAKQIYGWPVIFPQMMALGYVEIAEPAYAPGT